MEQTVDSQPTKRSRVSWKNVNVVKTFLETCVLEIAMNGKEGGSLKSLSWAKVAETLKDVHNFDVDRKQMRNHYDYLKGKYGAWLKLKNKTGNVYDPSTNSFNLTPEQWDVEIKSNRFVESLRTTSLPFPDLCAQLFEGGVLKVRFPILKQMAPFPFTKQRNVVIACFAIHNFIRKCKIQDQLFMEFNEETVFTNDEEDVGNGEAPLDGTQWGANSTQYMATLRDEIANQLVPNA